MMKIYKLILLLSIVCFFDKSIAQPTFADSKIGSDIAYVRNLIGFDTPKKFAEDGTEYLEKKYSIANTKLTGIVAAAYYFNENHKCNVHYYIYEGTKYLEDVVNKFNRNTYDYKKVPNKFMWQNDREHYYVDIKVDYDEDRFVILYKAN